MVNYNAALKQYKNRHTILKRILASIFVLNIAKQQNLGLNFIDKSFYYKNLRGIRTKR